MPNRAGTQLLRTLDWAVCKAAGVTFDTVQFFNKYQPNPSFTPKWSDKPLLKSWEKTKPTLGWPRQTDSLCPDCVKEAREAIVHGQKRSEEHTSELQSRLHLVCRLLLEKKKHDT